MKIVTVVGARPQFIKAAAGSRQIRKEHQEILVHTGQHFDDNMSEVFFREMEIPAPDYNLGISGGTHGQMTARMLMGIEDVLLKEKPYALLVYGDTNSTLAAALAAVKLHIPVMHVEAGNRLGSLDNPEEVNRILTDHCSTLRFCATQAARDKLRAENLSGNSWLVGNIMYDSFLHFADRPWTTHELAGLNGQNVGIPREYSFMTCHRQENTYSDEPLTEIFPWRKIAAITGINIALAGVFYLLKRIITLDTLIGEVAESILLGIIWSAAYLFIMRKRLLDRWHKLNQAGGSTEL